MKGCSSHCKGCAVMHCIVCSFAFLQWLQLVEIDIAGLTSPQLPCCVRDEVLLLPRIIKSHKIKAVSQVETASTARCRLHHVAGLPFGTLEAARELLLVYHAIVSLLVLPLY